MCQAFIVCSVVKRKSFQNNSFSLRKLLVPPLFFACRVSRRFVLLPFNKYY